MGGILIELINHALLLLLFGQPEIDVPGSAAASFAVVAVAVAANPIDLWSASTHTHLHSLKRESRSHQFPVPLFPIAALATSATADA